MRRDESDVNVKQELINILEFLKYKLVNDKCTMAEMKSLSKTIVQNMTIEGTVEDFAKFYGVSEANVRNVIHRYSIDKPIRRVYYKFTALLKIIPLKWLSNIF